MSCHKKYQVFLGIFLIQFPNGITWYYGNLSSYTASALRYYLGPQVDVETVWLLSVFIGLWTSGLTLGALLQKLFPRPKFICLGGVLVFDAAFAATSWTIKHSLAFYVLSFGALTGLADGFIYTSCIAFIPMWEKYRVGLATALSTSGLGVGAVVINQIISMYVNPNNKVADKPDGNIKLFSHEEISKKVPNLFLLLTVFNLIFHISGILLLRTKPVEDKIDSNKVDKEPPEIKGTMPIGNAVESKFLKPSFYSINNESVSTSIISDNCIAEKACPWSYSFDSEVPKQRVCCHDCNLACCKENARALSGPLITDNNFGFQSGKLCSYCDSKMFGISNDTPTNLSSCNGGVKDLIIDGSPPTFSGLGSDTIRSSFEDPGEHAVSNKADNSNTSNCAVPKIKPDQSPSGKTSDGERRFPTSYGSTKDTGKANDISIENSEEDYESRNFTPGEMICSKMFFVLWVTQFSLDYSLSVLTNYYKLYGELYIPDDHFLAYLGTVMTASLIIPKLGWGWALDLWGVKDTLVCMTSCTVLISSFWYFTATINRYLYSGLTLALCWCVSAIDSLAAAAVLKAFGPAHFNINYGLVASSSIFFNMVTPLGMKALVNNLGWAGLFLSVGIMNFVILVLTFFYTSK